MHDAKAPQPTSGEPTADQLTAHGVASEPITPQRASIADLLDRVVDQGAVVSGDVIISLAGIDLIRLDLRLLLIGVDRALHPRTERRTA